jgi:fructose-bisphosphate aldolase/2-amino-3,7-dideoxy-D-threo-hept-6-ulosonate synthase
VNHVFQTGKILRLGRVFDNTSHRAVIVAMDHGLFMGPVRGLEKPVEVARRAIKGGANAIILAPGTCRLVADEIKGQVAVILRIDGATTLCGPDLFDIRRIASVEDAARMGAQAVIAMGYLGTARESETLANLSLTARNCEKLGVPLVAEMVPVQGEKIKDPYDPQVVGLAARVGAEIGADLIKTHYTGSPSTFREVVKGCPVPIVIAGGPKTKTVEQVLKVAKEAVDAGAAGIAFGRNIWQHENPEAMTRAVARIVHGKATVQQAMKGF